MSSLALYRTYRPSRFADVVGQEHVTAPLMRALEHGRLHHAYLFSGPRGCGKTSSARILARSLNCEKGPAPEPCGQCQSCIDLAPGGAGSIDVIELDAATHGLVDDARDLREKAHFAPVQSRYKVYIIDEAHQLGPGAANALLKLIEEPPAHLIFIFATTAPDKILPTIRSRTHHYPFRLIPAKTLQQNLAWICEQEGVAIEPAALALVARAGAGSARDAQSVLGQLIAGADEHGVTYDLAVALLGFTDAALLDQVVDAIADSDAPTVFGAVDRVMESGHDPRRFLTDLLERFRDLVVVQAVPDAAASGLIDVPEDQAERMVTQAGRFGVADLVRLADVIDEGITAMKGATPTRLQLELVCARLLLPGADHSVEGVQARLDRLERRIGGLAAGGGVADTAAQPTASDPGTASPRGAGVSDPGDTAAGFGPAPSGSAAPGSEESAPAGRARTEAAPDEREMAASDSAAGRAGTGAGREVSGPASSSAPTRQAADPVSGSEGPGPTSAPTASAGGGGLSDIRRMWPEVLGRLREIKITPWSLISQESAVADFSDGRLTLAFRKPNLRDTFTRRQDFQEFLIQAVKDVLLIDVTVDAIVDPSAEPGSASGPASGGGAAAGRPQQASARGETPGGEPGGQGSGGPAPDGSAGDPERGSTPAPGRADAARAAARRGAASADDPSEADTAQAGAYRPADDLDADPDDADLDDAGLTERQLLEQTLGATVIDEVEHPR